MIYWLRLRYFLLLQDACCILRERLEPLKKENPDLTWPQLVGISVLYCFLGNGSKHGVKFTVVWVNQISKGFSCGIYQLWQVKCNHQYVFCLEWCLLLFIYSLRNSDFLLKICGFIALQFIFSCKWDTHFEGNMTLPSSHLALRHLGPW